MKYLRVKRWGEFQHGTKKRLPWIKLYDKLLEDYHFARLTEVEQLHLIKIWLLANRVGNKIPNDAAWVRSMIRSSRNPNLKKYIAEGFLERWTRATAERDTSGAPPEDESSTRTGGEPPGRNSASTDTPPANGDIRASLQVDEGETLASPDTDTDRELERERTEQGAALVDLEQIGRDLELKLVPARPGTVERLYEICDTIALNTRSVIASEAETLTPDTLERVRAEALATPGERIRKSRTALIVKLLQAENRRAA